MHPVTIVQAAIAAWEAKNTNAFASYLADNFICQRILPQTADKAQLLSYIKALATAFPDWSFNGRVLFEEYVMEDVWKVLFATAITATHAGVLILPTLPIIPATGRKIALPNRHLEFSIGHDRITAITADFSPNGLEEVLAHMGLELP